MNKNRGIIAVIGVFTQVLCGMISGWGTYSMFIGRSFPEWTATQLSTTYTITMLMFCVGCTISGYLFDKFKPRFFMWLTAAIYLIGLTITSKATNLGMLYIGVGVFLGFGSGFAYNPIFSTTGKWFPDRPGLISGILLVGYGLGGFAVGKLFQVMTTSFGDDWRKSFMILAIASFISFILSGLFIVNPDMTAAADVAKKPIKTVYNPVGYEATPKQMLRSASFWYYITWVVISSALGFMITSQASGMVHEVAPQVRDSLVATIIGLNSVSKCAVRAVVGGIYDKKGRGFTMQMLNIILAFSCVIFIVGLKTKSLALIVAGIFITGLSFGGVTPTNSVFIRSYFGSNNFSKNFSFINMNLLISSFGSTIGGVLYDASHTYMSTYVVMLICAFANIACSIGIGISDKNRLHKMNN